MKAPSIVFDRTRLSSACRLRANENARAEVERSAMDYHMSKSIASGCLPLSLPSSRSGRRLPSPDPEIAFLSNLRGGRMR